MPYFPLAQSVLTRHRASLGKLGLAAASSFPTHSTSQCIHFCGPPEMLVFADKYSALPREVFPPLQERETNCLGSRRKRADFALLNHIPMF